MIGYEQFKNQLIALTGRPDLAVAPYLIKTLATISRSGEFAEDMVSMVVDVDGDKFYEIGSRSTAYRYIDTITIPWYYSLRRLLSATLRHADYDIWGVLDLTVASSTTLESIERNVLRCPSTEGFAYMAEGSLMLFVPKGNPAIKPLMERGERLEVELILSTSNEKRAWAFCGEEVGGNSLELPYAARTETPDWPIFTSSEGADYIWQMNACLDLVLYGTAASQLRFAGHDKEAQLLYGEFLTGLRQFKADRDNQLVTNEGALGF